MTPRVWCTIYLWARVHKSCVVATDQEQISAEPLSKLLTESYEPIGRGVGHKQAAFQIIFLKLWLFSLKKTNESLIKCDGSSRDLPKELEVSQTMPSIEGRKSDGEKRPTKICRQVLNYFKNARI